jgi:protein-disulfide isomerase
MIDRKQIRIAIASLASAAALGAALLFGNSSAVAESAQTSFDTTQTEAIGQIVREYLLDNPEVMIEVFAKLEEQQAQQEQLAAQAAIQANQDALFNDDYSYVYGNPDGDITIVEFFDYKCPYCKRAVGDIMEAADEDGNVRLVFKEFPILSEESELAAKAAMAAISQNKYMELHLALMATQGGLDEERIMRVADDAGLDVDRLRQDMQDPGLDAAIERTQDLARAIGIEGTPAFVIGGQLVPGAVSKERLLEVVEQERTSCVSC